MCLVTNPKIKIGPLRLVQALLRGNGQVGGFYFRCYIRHEPPCPSYPITSLYGFNTNGNKSKDHD